VQEREEEVGEEWRCSVARMVYHWERGCIVGTFKGYHGDVVLARDGLAKRRKEVQHIYLSLLQLNGRRGSCHHGWSEGVF
jgi:hypothetical protein